MSSIPHESPLGLAAALVAFVSLAAPSLASAQRGAMGGEWPAHGGDLGSTKYSPLGEIDRTNAGRLAVAWRWTTVDARFDVDSLVSEHPALLVPNDTRNISISGLKATPLVVGGVMYMSTPLGQVAALDPGTGETLWTYDSMSYASGIPEMVLGFSSRGVAYWTDGERERVFLGTGDGYLVAVDAASGRPDPSFGAAGRVDLMLDIPRARRSPPPLNFSVTSAPLVCGDVVIVGSAISDQPETKEAPPGWVRGYDVRTGERAWVFHTIPLPGEAGHETWLEDSWRYTGNANVWTMMSADPERGLAYLPVGNATNDHYGGHRPGTNLFANSLVAVECATGRRVWHFQLVHHDLWDYDPPAAPTLVDVDVGGRSVPAVVQVTKHGFAFVFDRVTGEPVWPIEERPVPAGDVPGEWYAPTQPFPTAPPPFERQGVTEDDLIDFTPGLRAEAVRILRGYRTGPLFTPPAVKGDGEGGSGTLGTIALPGYTGGANWPGAGVDLETGILYVGSTTSPVVPDLVPPDATHATLRYMRGRMAPPEGPDGLPLLKPPYGQITAIDLGRGEILWQRPNGPGSASVREHERLRGLDLPELGGGRDFVLVTRTLLFTAQQQPNVDGRYVLVARDKATGEPVAEIAVPGRVIGSPMTYMAGGRQHIAMTVRPDDGGPPEVVALTLR